MIEKPTSNPKDLIPFFTLLMIIFIYFSFDKYKKYIGIKKDIGLLKPNRPFVKKTKKKKSRKKKKKT